MSAGRWLLATLPLALGAVALAAGSGATADLEGNLLAELLVLFGCVFLLAAAIGMLRFPDFYTRLHASTKLVTLGGVGIFGGAAIAFAPLQGTSRVLLIAAFFFLTAPLSGYMIARSGYLRGLAPYREESSVDEWAELGVVRGLDADSPSEERSRERPFGEGMAMREDRGERGSGARGEP